MLKIKYHKKFSKEFKKLPKSVQEKFLEMESILKKNHLDRRLKTKKLQGKLKQAFSFRVTQSYRATFYFISKNEISLFRVDHRKNIYKN